MEQLLSLGLGGILRLAPEVLDFFDRKARRAHDVVMADKGLEKGAIDAEGVALAEAVKAQGVLTGIRWADALNVLVRPVITYWWVIILYTAYLVASFVVILDSGEGMAASIVRLFGANEKGIVNTIISFWFVDRVIRYQRAKK
jgi:hypothetical protein